jgi:hypothetical protein
MVAQAVWRATVDTGQACCRIPTGDRRNGSEEKKSGALKAG